MIRKTLIALAAVATVAGASVAVPTAASAGWKHHHHHGHHHHGFGWRGFGVRVVTGGDYGCIRWVRVGYNSYKRVNICY